MTTVSGVLSRAARHLFTGMQEEIDTLSSSYTAGGTTLAFTNMTNGIQQGATLAIDIELFYVVSINQSAKTATVIYAQGGSTNANHASGAVVTINPKFSQFDLLQSLNEELDSLSSPENGLYQIKSLDITYQSPVVAYDITGESAGTVLGILDASWKTVDATKSWPSIRDMTIKRDMASSEFASTLAVVFGSTVPPPGRTVHVRYGATFAHVANLTDDVTTVSGFPATGMDILPLGVAIRGAAGREIKRNFIETQGETRRAAEVPAGAESAEIKNLVMLYQTRIQQEAMRLRKFYPLVSHVR